MLHSLYTCLIGSHAYGLATPESDTDLRGVVIPDGLEYYFGLETFDKPIEYKEDEDHVAWGLKQFAALAENCNTQVLEMLFSEKDNIRYCHPVFEENFIKNQKKFITKRIYEVIRGYSYSEYRKSIGESSRDLGSRRKEDLDKFGYSCRNASHCLRLLYAGSIALQDGVFPVRLDGSMQKICMDLKLGKLSLEEYKYLYMSFSQDLEQYYLDCTLPEHIDRAWLNKILIDTHLKIIHVAK